MVTFLTNAIIREGKIPAEKYNCELLQWARMMHWIEETTGV